MTAVFIYKVCICFLFSVHAEATFVPSDTATVTKCTFSSALQAPAEKIKTCSRSRDVKGMERVSFRVHLPSQSLFLRKTDVNWLWHLCDGHFFIEVLKTGSLSTGLFHPLANSSSVSKSASVETKPCSSDRPGLERVEHKQHGEGTVVVFLLNSFFWFVISSQEGHPYTYGFVEQPS